MLDTEQKLSYLRSRSYEAAQMSQCPKAAKFKQAA